MLTVLGPPLPSVPVVMAANGESKADPPVAEPAVTDVPGNSKADEAEEAYEADDGAKADSKKRTAEEASLQVSPNGKKDRGAMRGSFSPEHVDNKKDDENMISDDVRAMLGIATHMDDAALQTCLDPYSKLLAMLGEVNDALPPGFHDLLPLGCGEKGVAFTEPWSADSGRKNLENTGKCHCAFTFDAFMVDESVKDLATLGEFAKAYDQWFLYDKPSTEFPYLSGRVPAADVDTLCKGPKVPPKSIKLAPGAYEIYGGLVTGLRTAVQKGTLELWHDVLRSMVCTVRTDRGTLSNLLSITRQSSSLKKYKEISCLSALAEVQTFHEISQLMINNKQANDSGQSLSAAFKSMDVDPSWKGKRRCNCMRAVHQWCIKPSQVFEEFRICQALFGKNCIVGDVWQLYEFTKTNLTYDEIVTVIKSIRVGLLRGQIPSVTNLSIQSLGGRADQGNLGLIVLLHMRIWYLQKLGALCKVKADVLENMCNPLKYNLSFPCVEAVSAGVMAENEWFGKTTRCVDKAFVDIGKSTHNRDRDLALKEAYAKCADYKNVATDFSAWVSNSAALQNDLQVQRQPSETDLATGSAVSKAGNLVTQDEDSDDEDAPADGAPVEESREQKQKSEVAKSLNNHRSGHLVLKLMDHLGHTAGEDKVRAFLYDLIGNYKGTWRKKHQGIVLNPNGFPVEHCTNWKVAPSYDQPLAKLCLKIILQLLSEGQILFAFSSFSDDNSDFVKGIYKEVVKSRSNLKIKTLALTYAEDSVRRQRNRGVGNSGNFELIHIFSIWDLWRLQKDTRKICGGGTSHSRTLEQLELRNPKAQVQLTKAQRQQIFKPMLGPKDLVPCPTIEEDTYAKVGSLKDVLVLSFVERVKEVYQQLFKDYYCDDSIVDIFAAAGEVALACSSAPVGEIRPYTGCVFSPTHAAYVNRCVDGGLLMDAHGNAKLCQSLFAGKTTTSDIANLFPDIQTKIKIHGKDCIQTGSDSEGDET